MQRLLICCVVGLGSLFGEPNPREFLPVLGSTRLSLPQETGRRKWSCGLFLSE
jgi:hypothetical protein